MEGNFEFLDQLQKNTPSLTARALICGTSNGLAVLRVVLLAVNRARSAIFLAIDFRFFRWGQMTAIGGPVVVDFFINMGFTSFQTGSLTSIQLAALYSLRNTLLLIALALSDFAFGIDVLGLGVMRARIGSPTQPKVRLTMVTPSWTPFTSSSRLR